MKPCPRGLVIPVELSKDTKIPEGPFPGGWFQLGRHSEPLIVDRENQIDIREICNGPLILEFTGSKLWNPHLTCALPRHTVPNHPVTYDTDTQSHHPNFFDVWDPKCRVTGWPKDELTIRLARWIFAASRGRDSAAVSAPFVWVAGLKHFAACLETGHVVKVGNETDLPVVLALIPNEFLPGLASFAAELLLLETWALTASSSSRIAKLRGF